MANTLTPLLVNVLSLWMPPYVIIWTIFSDTVAEPFNQVYWCIRSRFFSLNVFRLDQFVYGYPPHAHLAMSFPQPFMPAPYDGHHIPKSSFLLGHFSRFYIRRFSQMHITPRPLLLSHSLLKPYGMSNTHSIHLFKI